MDDNKLDRVEYKTIRQYQTMGDMLDELRTYGYRTDIERVGGSCRAGGVNGHEWLFLEDE